MDIVLIFAGLFALFFPAIEELSEPLLSDKKTKVRVVFQTFARLLFLAIVIYTIYGVFSALVTPRP